MLEVVEDLPEHLEVAVSAIASVVSCGRCGAKTNRVHATKKVKVADLAHGGRPTTLVWHRRRFRCRSCRATTTETHPVFAERMTTRLSRAVVRDCADMTVSAACRRYGLHWHKVMALVLAHGALLAKARRRRATRVLLVDEKGHAQGPPQLLDHPQRRRPGTAVRKHLPHARHVADRFHVVRNFSKALVSARRDAQRTSRGKPHVPSVFHARFLLMKRCDRLSGEDVARLGAIFDANPELGVVWGRVQRFHVRLLRPPRGFISSVLEMVIAAVPTAPANSPLPTAPATSPMVTVGVSLDSMRGPVPLLWSSSPRGNPLRHRRAGM